MAAVATNDIDQLNEALVGLVEVSDREGSLSVQAYEPADMIGEPKIAFAGEWQEKLSDHEGDAAAALGRLLSWTVEQHQQNLEAVTERLKAVGLSV